MLDQGEDGERGQQRPDHGPEHHAERVRDLAFRRYDLALGTPPHALLLASSHGHSDNYPLVSEEITYSFPGRGGTQDPMIRADMTYFTTAADGACLSIGSIAWSQALPIKDGDNNVATLMRNVLNAFIKAGPLPGGEFVGEEKLWR